MITQIDLTDATDITATQYGTDSYEYVRTDRYYAIIEELSIGTDSNFRSNGALKGSIAGNPFTAQNTANDDISPLGNLSAVWEGPLKPILQPGQKVRLDFKQSSGTGVVQVLLRVQLVTETELRDLQARGIVV